MALYGKDRLTQALVRKDGKLVPVPMKEALDLVAAKMAETIKTHGKDAVAMYGSGQWTIPDGYVASKFMKGGIGTNNLEANARLCMASAVTGFMTTFGLDEPMGCYEDIDHADVFVLWGNNMAEMHPVLFSRLLDRRAAGPRREDHRPGHALDADQHGRRPEHPVRAPDRPGARQRHLPRDHPERLGEPGLRRQARVLPRGQDQHRLRPRGRVQRSRTRRRPSRFERYRELLEDYTPEKVERLSGVPARDIRYLASLYGDPPAR